MVVNIFRLLVINDTNLPSLRLLLTSSFGVHFIMLEFLDRSEIYISNIRIHFSAIAEFSRDEMVENDHRISSKC